MKIKLQRMSGRPVDPAKASQWETERREFFDKTARKYYQAFLTATGSDIVLPEDLDFQQIPFAQLDNVAIEGELKAFDKELDGRYSMFEVVELPKNMKGWRAFMDQYQCPTMVAQSSEGKNEFVLVLMDDAFG